MLFVTLGTQDKSFKRLIDYFENLDTDEEIIVQSGLTNYISNKLKIEKFFSNEGLEKNIQDARIVITHGGVGTIINALNHHKVVIACARLAKYHEHHNDHQVQIIDEFEKAGYLLALRDGDDIKEVLKRAENFVPKQYESNTENFVKKLDDYLSGL